jgi:LysM repeat protein
MEEKMKSRTTLSLLVIIVLAFSLSACTRSAAAPQDSVVLPEAATPDMEMVQAFATQTAVASELFGDATPEATDDPFALPESGETSEPGAEVTPEEESQPAESQPEPAVVVPQPTVETVRPASYILQKGEFPYCIARRFNVNPAELLSLNGLTISQSTALRPGLVLNIPQTGVFNAERALLPHPAQYTVQSGDTIYSIACKYGDVDPVNIAAVNGLAAPYTLTVGTVLQIP